MGKGLDKFLNLMRLNDDDYDEDYDDEFSEDYNDYTEDYDDYDDEPEEPEVPKKKKTTFHSRKPASSPAPEPVLSRAYSSSSSSAGNIITCQQRPQQDCADEAAFISQHRHGGFHPEAGFF